MWHAMRGRTPCNHADWMPRPPSIHVLIPTYERAALLRVALESVAIERRPGVRITVVDDASACPDVKSVASEFSTRGVEYVRNAYNVGIGRNFQRCVDLADGDYVVIMGSDDFLLPGYVSTIRRAAAAYDCPEMLHPGVIVVDEYGRPFAPMVDRVKAMVRRAALRPGAVSGRTLATSLALGNWMYFPSIAWRLDALRRFGFVVRYRTVMDLDLALKIAMANGRMGITDERAFAYRRHRSSVSSTEAKAGTRFAEEDEVMRRLATEAAREGWRTTALAATLRPTSRLHRVGLRALQLRDRTN